jgi:transmembrane sensor
MIDQHRSPDDQIARVLAGEATPSEIETIQAWRRASPDNEARYRAMARIAELAAALPGTVAAGPPPTLADLEPRIRAGRPAAGRVPGPGRRRGRWQTGWLAAATVILGLGLGVAYLAVGSRGGGYAGGEMESLATGPSEPATLTFRDGTVVRLAPDSRITVGDFQGERRVTLTGRAYFAVATDAEGRPFIVDTRAGEVRVLGTRFDLTARAEDLEVVVVEGRVALSSRGVDTEIGSGQLGRVVKGTPLPAIEVDDPYQRMGWVGKFLAFHATPLDAAVLEIEHRYQVSIRITDPALASRTITAWFSDWELEDVMTVFCTIAEATCIRDGDEIRVAPLRPNGE